MVRLFRPPACTSVRDYLLNCGAALFQVYALRKTSIEPNCRAITPPANLGRIENSRAAPTRAGYGICIGSSSIILSPSWPQSRIVYPV